MLKLSQVSLFAMMLALAACGGGGGNDDGGTPAEPIPGDTNGDGAVDLNDDADGDGTIDGAQDSDGDGVPDGDTNGDGVFGEGDDGFVAPGSPPPPPPPATPGDVGGDLTGDNVTGLESNTLGGNSTNVSFAEGGTVGFNSGDIRETLSDPTDFEGGLNLFTSDDGTINVWTTKVGLESLGATLDHTRYGIWAQTAGTEGATIDEGAGFAGGDVSVVTDVPTSGSANYSGGALAVVDGGQQITGTSSLDVDFATRAVGGTLSLDPYTVTLSGEIGGANRANTFNGSASVADGSAGNFNGRFFGPAAGEAGGVFNTDGTTTMRGSFGGAATTSE